MPEIAPNPINWLKFIIVLIAPATVCFMSMAMNFVGAVILFGLFGGLVSGVICARMIMKSVALAGFQRGLAHLGLAFVLCCLSYFLCFLGCVGR